MYSNRSSRQHRRRRAVLLCAAFCLTLSSRWWTEGSNEGIRVAIAKDSSRPYAEFNKEVKPEIVFDLENIKLPSGGRGLEPLASPDLFSNETETPAIKYPPKASLPVAPAAPVVPPFNYKYIGKMVRDNEIVVFMSRGDEIISVVKGDILNGEFRIEDVMLDKLDIAHVATKTRMTKRYDELLGSPSLASHTQPQDPYQNMPVYPDNMQPYPNFPGPIVIEQPAPPPIINPVATDGIPVMPPQMPPFPPIPNNINQ